MHKPRGLTTQVLRFAGAGVAGLVVDAGVLYLMMGLGLGWAPARVLSFLAAVWATWQLNRRYTFEASGASAWRQWWRYLLAMSGGGLVNYAAYSAVMLYAAHWWPLHLPISLLPLFAVAVGSLAGMAVNFASAKFFVFSR